MIIYTRQRYKVSSFYLIKGGTTKIHPVKDSYLLDFTVDTKVIRSPVLSY